LRIAKTLVSSGPKWRREIEMALVVERLVGEDQHGIACEGGLDRGDVVGRERPAEIDVADLGGERGRDGVDGDGQWFLPIPCLAVIGPLKDGGCKCLS
jgi:hypothetical protein